MIQRTEAIVLHRRPFRDTSYIVTLYTSAFGKVQGVCKAARRAGSPFSGQLELFTRLEIIFYEKKRSGLDLITEASLIDFFPGLRVDWDRLIQAAYVADLVKVATDFKEPVTGVFELLEEALTFLATNRSRPKLEWFEIQLLERLGYMPAIEECLRCEEPVKGPIFFHLGEGGVLCTSCKRHADHGFGLSGGALETLRFLSRAESLVDAMRLNMSKQTEREVSELLRKFWDYRLEVFPKSRAFLTTI